jgi:hypothetical protein
VEPVATEQNNGGGIRGLSELLLIKGVMHRLIVGENTERKKGWPSASSEWRRDYFDLIGATGTGGCVGFRFIGVILILPQDNCFSARACSGGCKYRIARLL